ncbi:MAG: hypothetical protein WA827_19045 [Candidatus Binatus sp.]
MQQTVQLHVTEDVMLNMIGHVVGMTAIFVNITAVISAVSLTLRQRLIAGGVAGAWVGLATALGAAGALAFSPEHPVPLVGVMFAVPLLTTAALWLASSNFRAALMAIPMSLLIGLNALRILGWLFLALAAVGRLSGPFPFSAGLGDMITGSLAIPLALRVARGEQASVASWNVFGALDLFFAVGLGLTSSQGSPLQILHVGVGAEAMQHLPFSLVPTVLVPFYLITHGIIAAQLATRRKAQTLATA